MPVGMFYLLAYIGREAALHIIEGREGGRVTRIPCPLLIRCST